MQPLLEHLRALGEEKVTTIWQQAEAEVQRQKEEAAAVLAEERRRHHLQELQALEIFGRSLMRAAEEKSWQRRFEVETCLAQRLYELARTQLPWLREQCGSKLFKALAEELPKVKWRFLSVNEGEIDLGRRYFPEAQITVNADISGGLVAESEDGAIKVINTLEKRLERAWPQMLPELFRKIRQEQEGAS